jgi:hypothetical protein
MRRLFRRKPPTVQYVVMWWPTTDAVVPELIGPFTSIDRGLAVRGVIRESQRREEKMAQMSPVAPGPRWVRGFGHWQGAPF